MNKGMNAIMFNLCKSLMVLCLPNNTGMVFNSSFRSLLISFKSKNIVLGRNLRNIHKKIRM